jgi:hypothetical protein
MQSQAMEFLYTSQNVDPENIRKLLEDLFGSLTAFDWDFSAREPEGFVNSNPYGQDNKHFTFDHNAFFLWRGKKT